MGARGVGGRPTRAMRRRWKSETFRHAISNKAMLARMKLNRPCFLPAAGLVRSFQLGGALLLALVLGGGARSAFAQTSLETKDDPARRKALLEELRRLLPKSEPWEKWLAASGELPPDFEKMTGMAFLPGPMKFADGHLSGSPSSGPRGARKSSNSASATSLVRCRRRRGM